ncbi:DNA polymerase III subunit alpha [Phocicoccus pinnipedialis]|uniref:DNA-directed DNA polymerase n=1 Tax=Phocicoccus pinnipedialis TaxID=110845 RepID=A0A6V7RDL4_9BACL|nr:DNA polymerase III subunit alpha [Jeotgalicoccus pinnipedialis]MBP1939501.1 DNA polymerase-3 subunit alpha [Jeotgalicoccus pinnipedialis]CAD2075120.1 DNA polymerase III subunit alpha [Jeotgalicoccus pinnipedialis]
MINLNVHSSYEFLNSNIKIDQLLEKIDADGQRSVAITDFNFMHNTYEFIQCAQKKNVKPVVGLAFSLDDGMEGIPFVLYAKNMTGYAFLARLSSRLSYSNLTRTPISYLKDMTDCIIVAKTEKGVSYLDRFSIDQDDKYISHRIENLDGHKPAYIEDVFYLEPDDKHVVDVLRAIQMNTKLDIDFLNRETGNQFVKTFDDIDLSEEILLNNQEIVDKCNVELPHVEFTLPKYDKTRDSKAYLLEELEIAFQQKIHSDHDNYRERMIYEYKTIVNMHYEDYFLIVSDLIRYAKRSDIYVGPGRGSSSASLVSYLLDITDLDPLKYDLLFERFLNPERVSMPDIDIDFASVDVPRVISYLKNKYGDMNVAHILTYSNLTAKSAAREVGRIFSFTDSEMREISNIIDENNNDLIEAIDSERFKNLVELENKYTIIRQIAPKLLGLPRNTSQHASGILLGREPLVHDIPTMFDGDTMKSQWPMNDVEAAGLLKIDVLSLNTLTLVRYINQLVKRKHPNFDINTVPFDDVKTFKLLSAGQTSGIFQLESDGITNVLRRYKPENLMDLALVLALYRPGPMGEIDSVVKKKHGKEIVEYPLDEIKSILKDTYGVMIFQEQIMQVARKVAGYSLAEADLMRRSMAKKNRETMMKEEKKFISGGIRNGFDEDTVSSLFSLILKFADYGFPKSHALVYAMTSYRMAYLKAHFREEFYAVMLMEHRTEEDKRSKTLAEMKRLGVDLKRPSINKSRYVNTVDGGVQLGFGMIKSVSKKLADAFIENRTNEPYTDLYDFVTKNTELQPSETQLQMLILSGAMDDFNENRKTMLQTVPRAIEVIKDGLDYGGFLETLGFGVKKEFQNLEEMSQMEMIEGEATALNFFISTHPVLLTEKDYEYIPFDLLSKKQKGQLGTFLLYNVNVRKITTKNKEEMAYINVTDGRQEIDAVLFPRNYYVNIAKLQNKFIVVNGRMDEYRGTKQLVINAIYNIEEYTRAYLERARYVYIRNTEYGKVKDLFNTKGIPVFNIKKEQMGLLSPENYKAIITRAGKQNIRFML